MSITRIVLWTLLPALLGFAAWVYWSSSVAPTGAMRLELRYTWPLLLPPYVTVARLAAASRR